MTLDDLIAKLEAADGPDRELDEAIWLALRCHVEPQRAYTASLDAAMTLLEQGDWTLCAVTDEECLCTLPAGYGLEDAVHGVAATPALALTAAALRARKEM